jgi:hypothetical protein
MQFQYFGSPLLSKRYSIAMFYRFEVRNWFKKRVGQPLHLKLKSFKFKKTSESIFKATLEELQRGASKKRLKIEALWVE